MGRVRCGDVCSWSGLLGEFWTSGLLLAMFVWLVYGVTLLSNL